MRSSATQQKKAWHKKSRNGCLTCRRRRVKCDESKPSCVRCTSTGRSCDFAHPARASEPAAATADAAPATTSQQQQQQQPPPSTLALALPRNSPEEVRSFHFFLHVAAPALSDVFDGDFWIVGVPRATFADRAVWHAAVAVGAAYEAFAGPGRTTRDDGLVLRQCNHAIRALTEPGSGGRGRGNLWRALITSVLFSFICSLQGAYEQCGMHFSSGRKILRAIMAEEKLERVSPGAPQAFATPASSKVSLGFGVALPTVDVIIQNLESHAQAMEHGNMKESKTVNHSYNLWRFYQTPRTVATPKGRSSHTQTAGIIPERILTPLRKDIAAAVRAAESLFYGLLLLAQENDGHLVAVATKGDQASLQALLRSQAPHGRCYVKLNRSLAAFRSASGIDAERDSRATSSSLERSTSKALLSLDLLLTTIRAILIHDPEIPDPAARAAQLGAQYGQIVGLAERVLKLQTGRDAFLASISPTQALVLVAHSGFPQATRRRAVQLLRDHPRCNGLFDTAFAAALAAMMMEREQAAVAERGQGGIDEDRGGDVEVDMLDRGYSYRIAFLKGQRALVTGLTWRDFIQGRSGCESLLEW